MRRRLRSGARCRAATVRAVAGPTGSGVEDLARRAAATRRWFDQLGGEVVALPGGVAVRNPDLAQVHDANHLVGVRASTATEVEVLERAAASVFGGRQPAKVVADPGTPEPYEAHLAMAGRTLVVEVELVLAGALRPLGGSGAVATDHVVPVEGDADWAAYAELVRLDGDERAEVEGRPPWPAGVAEAIAAFRRGKEGPVRTWGVRAGAAPTGGELVAFLSSAPGIDGMGVVEHLFTHPDHRGRGHAVALLHRAVADARQRGADEVLIGARPDDTPKELYRRLGFAPVRLHRMWMAA